MAAQSEDTARWGGDREAELVRRAQAQPEAFGDLYELYYGRILSFVYRRVLDALVAEDITSNTFFKALRALPEYHHHGHFGAWLYRIAINEIRLHRRTASNHRASDCRWREELGRVCFVSQPFNEKDDAEAKMYAFVRLHEALVRLPDEYQEALSLHYFEAMSYAQIAEVLGKRLGTVKSLVHRGLEKLRGQFEREPQE